MGDGDVTVLFLSRQLIYSSWPTREIKIRGGSWVFKDGYASNNHITSVPEWRKNHRDEKNDRYFDFGHLKFYTLINISYITA